MGDEGPWPCQILWIALGILLIILSPEASQGVTFDVDRMDDDPTAWACTAAPGDCSLRGAVRAANELTGPDTIVIPSGLYEFTVVGGGEDLALTGDLDILEDVSIQGAGAGLTVVHARELDRVFDVFPHVIFLDGFESGDTQPWGAGGTTTSPLLVSMSSLSLTGGRAPTDGGGIRLAGSLTLVVEDCAIEDNLALRNGGGVASALQGRLVISRSLLAGNSASGTVNAENGGAISSFGELYVTDSTLTDNTAGASMGGIRQRYGLATVTGSTFSGNRANQGSGGAIGVSYVDLGVAIDNTTFSENSTIGGGGAIYSFSSVVELTHVTFAGNIAETGWGDSVFSASNSVGEITLTNTLLDGGCFVGGDFYRSQGGNLESPADSCGLDHASDQVFVADTLLGALADNGGLTMTLALMPGSPAIDEGLEDLCAAVDQRGQIRPVDGDGDGTPECDVGAFELQ